MGLDVQESWLELTSCRSLGDGRSALSRVLEQDVIEKCPPLWGLTNEGEVRGCYRELGSKNLWSVMGMSSVSYAFFANPSRPTGNLAYCRIHSRHIALRKFTGCLLSTEATEQFPEIKAIEKGIFGERYSA